MAAPHDVLDDLALPPPRSPEVVERVTGALGWRRARGTTLVGASGVLVALEASAHPVVFAGGLVSLAGLMSVQHVIGRRWARRLARDGVLVDGELARAPGTRPMVVVTYEVGGVRATARARLDAGAATKGTARVLALPDEQPRWVHVFGPRGPMLWRVDPVALPHARVRRT